MTTPRLSICIPTYNRRKYLGDTITSITTQVSAADASRIEICVSDNASTDGTEILIRELQSSTPVRIIFSRNETNLGADSNYLRAVELASGDYCWYMGSDDTVAPGSLTRLLREIDEGHDIYLCNRIDCDIEMTYIRDRFWLDKSIKSEVFDFTVEDQFRRYAKHSLSVGALFGYLSSIAFKREKWQAVTIDPVFMGTAYSHVYMLMSFIKTGCKLKYFSDHLIKSRGGNDSFWAPSNEGIVNRIMIDIDGYLLLAERSIEFVADRGLSSRVDPAQWQAMVAGGQYQALAEGLMAAHYDPRYGKHRARAPQAPAKTIHAPSLALADLGKIADQIAAAIPLITSPERAQGR